MLQLRVMHDVHISYGTVHFQVSRASPGEMVSLASGALPVIRACLDETPSMGLVVTLAAMGNQASLDYQDQKVIHFHFMQNKLSRRRSLPQKLLASVVREMFVNFMTSSVHYNAVKHIYLL